MRNIRSYLVAAALLLTACSGSGIDGEYTDDTGKNVWKFQRNGKIEMTASFMGTTGTQELGYEVEDGKVKLAIPGAPKLVMSFDKDGCLDGGPMVGKMCKKK